MKETLTYKIPNVKEGMKTTALLVQHMQFNQYISLLE
jgi:hypothetical protein